MGSLSIDLLTLLLALTVLYAGPAVMFGVLIGSVLLIPATLVTPHLHTSYATVNHLLVAAALIRVAAMARRGLLSRDCFRATPLHLALALLIATWGIAGVVFAPSTEVSATALQRLAELGFAIGFFVVMLALLRHLDDVMLAVKLLTGFLAVTAVIAVLEHFTRDAYGHWLFQAAGHPGPTTAAHVLETRAGHVRARASGEFALAYAWVAVMLLPAAALVALRMRRVLRVGLPVIALILLAIYWTYSRSAAAAVPVLFLLLAATVRDRRTLFAGGAAALGVLVLFALDPTIHHHLSLSTDSGSVGIRFQRLPPILNAVSTHPYLGLGLGGLQSIAVTTTDNFYLAAYGETGVVGAAVLVAVCLTAVVQAGRGIVVTDRVRRAVVMTSTLGFIGFLASGLFDDALLLAQPAQLGLLLVAMATAAAEPELGYTPLPQWSAPRVAVLTAAGALIGLAAYLVAPIQVSQERTFTTIGPLRALVSGGGDVGQSLIGTVCALSKTIAPTLPKTTIDCRDDYTAPGLGTLRVEAPTTQQTLHAYATLKSVANRTYYLSDFQTHPTGEPIAARATAWRTAPVSGAVLGFALAFIAPLPFLRRRRPAAVGGEPRTAAPLSTGPPHTSGHDLSPNPPPTEPSSGAPGRGPPVRPTRPTIPALDP
jgi:hypothetical protein